MRPGQQDILMQKLEEIRQRSQHTFPGTIARFIVESETIPEQVEISFVWRNSIMPTERDREHALEAFRESLGDVLDWSTAQYSNGKVLMHT